MEIPDLGDLNLDCYSVDAAAVYKLAEHLRNLARYAEAKADAMAYRNRGNVVRAKQWESLCENIYATLPDNWKW